MFRPDNMNCKRAAGVALALLAAAGCSDSGPRPIIGSRELAPEEKEIRIVATDAERFREESDQSAGNAGSGVDLSFDFDLPEGWTEGAPSAMRVLNFTVGEDGECYMALLPGGGGGLVPNVNRWRGQMGLEPLDATAIGELPSRKLFGRPATFVSIDGSFSGMGAAEAKENYRMLGVILASEAGTVFVKFTGPRELVEAHGDNFETFCASLKPVTGG